MKKEHTHTTRNFVEGCPACFPEEAEIQEGMKESLRHSEARCDNLIDGWAAHQKEKREARACDGKCAKGECVCPTEARQEGGEAAEFQDPLCQCGLPFGHFSKCRNEGGGWRERFDKEFSGRMYRLSEKTFKAFIEAELKAAIAQAEERGRKEGYTAAMLSEKNTSFIAGQATGKAEGAAEERESIASLVERWHISKGGYSELAHVIRTRLQRNSGHNS